MKLPDRIFGKEIEGAYEKYLARAKKPEPIQERNTSITTKLTNPNDYIIIPNTDILIAKEETFKGLNWNDTHFKLAENGLFMPTIQQFIFYFKNVVLAYNGKEKLYSGDNKELSKDEIEDIYKYLTSNHRKGCWTWLDAKFFEDSSKDLGIETEHRVINNKLEGQPDSLDDYVKEDCYVELEFNKQGLPIKKSNKQKYKQGKNIYFYKPVNGAVAWFYAFSDRAVLICGRNPGGADSALGVFACAKGTQKI